MPVLFEWLEEFNRRMGELGTPHRDRPLRAWLAWCRETRESLYFGDPKAKEIFRWFEENSPPNSLYEVPEFVGAFYFDAYFWPVHIGQLVGTQMLDGRDALATMPKNTMARLLKSVDDLENFKALWADCLDYGYGFGHLRLVSASSPGFWRELIESGDIQLRSAIQDLCVQVPVPNAIQSSMLACEIFLKAFLARNDGLTPEDARKKYSHKLEKAMDRVLEITTNPIFGEAKNRLSSFPCVDDRYQTNGTRYSGSELWHVYKVTQAVAAEVIRSATSQDCRAQLANRF